MFGLMVAFNTTRVTPVSGGRNEGLNFRNVAVKSKTTGVMNHGSGGSIGRKIDC